MPRLLHASTRPDARRDRRVRWATLTLLAAIAVSGFSLVAPAWTQATSGAKVVVVVGPVARLNATYKSEAREVVAEARRHTSNVVVLFTPRATWARVRDAARNASVFVYFGHGWGSPSPYGPFNGAKMNGMALDPPSGADGRRRIYYGEDRIRAAFRFAPDAAVLLYRLCYASGNTEPGMSEGTTAQSRHRVDGYGAGFLDAGAGVVLADGHPGAPANYMRQLFSTNRSMWEIFRAAPNDHRHALGPYRSGRTAGATYVLDPDRRGTNPSGFYRSIVGDLSLRTTVVTGRAPASTPSPPPSSPSPTPTTDPTPSPTEEPAATASSTPVETATPDATFTPSPPETPPPGDESPPGDSPAPTETPQDTPSP